MDSMIASVLAFAAIFGGALAGVGVARRLPEPHLSGETRTAVSVSMAVVGTLAALVLSLLLTTASGSFNARADAVAALGVDIVKLNRALLRYGPEASTARKTLVDYAQAKARALSAASDASGLNLKALHVLETLDDQVTELRPSDDRQRHIQARALQLTDAIADARWLLVEKASIALPVPFLLLLIFWLALLFASFGLFAPRNGTVIAVLFVCALAISGGILMILELGAPMQRLVRVPVEPLLGALVDIAPDR